MQETLAPLSVIDPPAKTWYFPDELTSEEKEEVLLLNRQRGTYPLIEYRNSRLGRNDELSHKRERFLRTHHRVPNTYPVNILLSAPRKLS